jgi:hypothetical protein
LREKVLRDLASRAAIDAGFLKQARRDLKGTLAGFGYELTLEELRLVEDLRRRTAAISDEQLACVLASGLRGRTSTPPALVEEYLEDLPYLVDQIPLIREYETISAERTPENPLGIYTLTPRGSGPSPRKKSLQGGESQRPRGSGSFMLCSGFGRQSTPMAPLRSRWGPPAKLRRELCRATDQAHHPPPLRRLDEPIR